MAKNQQMIGYLDLARILVREYKIHDGHWHVALTFGSVGGIMANLDSGTGTKMLPAAVVPVLGVSLLRADEPNMLTVDAAAVNPKSAIISPHNAAGSPFFN